MPISWEAIYTDGSNLKQYNESKESSFNDIDLSKLFEFRLIYNNSIISLFMPSGTFAINGLMYNTDLSYCKLNYRLIYFVRRQKVLGKGNNVDKYCIGFQVTKDGKNFKKIIEVCNNEFKFIKK